MTAATKAGSVVKTLLIEYRKTLVYSLEAADDVVAGMMLVDVIRVMAVVLGRAILAGPAVVIEKVVVTFCVYVVTTKIYVPPD
jgi:hypothetical protein